MEALEHEFADQVRCDNALHAIEEVLRDEDLARLGLVTEARSQVGHRPNDAVIASTFESDGPDRRKSGRDPSLTQEEKSELIRFLEALSGEPLKIEVPALP
jgi:hypothetical protein